MTGIVDSVDVSVEVWGSLVTDLAAADLPHGVSPDCQDVQFQIGSVKTRPGITALASTPLPNSPTIQYMKTYENLQEVPRFLSLDSLGILRKDSTPGGSLTSIYPQIIAGSFCRSDSLFGREYLAFGNPTNGLDIPRQYDDTNFDRISQVGPGAPPAVADEATPVYIIDEIIQNTLSASSMSEVGTTVTATFGAGVPFWWPGLKVGDFIQVSSATDSGYNGTYAILEIGTNTLVFQIATSGRATVADGFFTFGLYQVVLNPQAAPYAVGQTVIISGASVSAYDGTYINRLNYLVGGAEFIIAGSPATLGVSTGGTATGGGNISAGVHGLSVIFVTRSGYYTKPAPPIYWTAAGNFRATVSLIPTGPPNVIARILCFTGANLQSFYHLQPPGLTIFSSNMVIPDNTTTSLTVDFTDQVLLLGTLDDPLFNQIELPPVAGILGYSSRLFAWGEQANLQAFLNLTFDGGFGPVGSAFGPFWPLGWTLDPTYGAGGYSANNQGLNVIFGDGYAIRGDGATAIRGLITQSAAADYLGNAILTKNTAYGVRARIAVGNSPTPVAGTVHINLYSPSLGITTPGLSVPYSALGIYCLPFEATLTTGLTEIPDDLVLQVYVDGTPGDGAAFAIDNIEIYPLNARFNNSNVRASFAQLPTQGQESFDSETGLIQYNLNDGQSVRNLFKIRERLYIVKEHSFGVTQDDNVNEPSLWSVQDVSKAVGTPSVNGVGVGEDWVVIAHRTGLYLFWGGEVLKISQEIQPTWDTINWEYGSLISLTVDTRKRRILICAPFGESEIPNLTLVLDYHDVGSDPASIAANPPIHLTYTGRKTAFDRARKWCPWTISANCVAQIELSNGETGIYFGSNDGTGNVNVLDDAGTVFTDNGNNIPSYYTTAAFAELPTEEAKQLKSHRHLYTYLTMFVQGNGNMGVTVFPASLSNAIALNPQTLSNPAFQDMQMMLNQSTERMFFKLSSGGTGQWIDLQRMVVNIKPEPWSILR